MSRTRVGCVSMHRIGECMQSGGARCSLQGTGLKRAETISCVLHSICAIRFLSRFSPRISCACYKTINAAEKSAASWARGRLGVCGHVCVCVTVRGGGGIRNEPRL